MLVAYGVRVQVKGKSDSNGPTVDSREEAERDVAEIRRTLGSSEAPDLPWLAVLGEDVVSADVVERDPERSIPFEKVEQPIAQLEAEG